MQFKYLNHPTIDVKMKKSALISVFNKEGIAEIAKKLHELNYKIFSTGGTEKFLVDLGLPIQSVESVTDYPSILGGRVKTLHPKIFGGILNRRDHDSDRAEVQQYEIPNLDVVIVDLYPFEKTVASGASEEDIIEKIDIGGISLIRAAAKNFKDVFCVSSQRDYPEFLQLLSENKGEFSLADKKRFAAKAFNVSSHYDTAIFNYLNEKEETFKISLSHKKSLRYGENPHQKGSFYGDFDQAFKQLHGKELSYNNLLDVDAAVNLMNEFQGENPTFAILKHNNACGVAQRDTLVEAYKAALAGDPVSAFGGILISNTSIDKQTAQEIDHLFCEVVIAPSFDSEAFEILTSKKNRILLEQKENHFDGKTVRSCLNGVLVQDRDLKTDQREDLETVTKKAPDSSQIEDLLFASKISKHTKSNTIVLAKNKQLCASGTGQTSRVDALNQAVEKARVFKFDLNGAVMASDAFFPFPDCVEIADKAGITAVLQPGGSKKDNLSIDYCDQNDMAMVFTGVRHFKH